MGLLFIGERRSPTAMRMGVTWEDGRLCAKNLHQALRAIGIEPADCQFRNAFDDEGRAEPFTVHVARAHVERGGEVIALGLRASGVLARDGVPHRVLVHPAARGAIRKRERYEEHVRETLWGFGQRNGEG